MLNLRAALVLAYMTGLLWLIRNPLSLAFIAASPFTILFLLFIITGGSYLGFALAGSIVMLLVNTGVSLGSDATMYRIENKFQDIVVASPVSPLTYMIGIALSELLFSGPALVVLSGIVLYQGMAVGNFTAFLGVVLLTWLSTTSLGFFLSTYVPNTRNSWQIASVMGLFLSVFPPVFYPLELIPTNLQWLAYLAPTTHSAILMRATMGYSSLEGWNIVVSWLSLVAFAFFFVGLALFKARWRQP